MKILLTGATGYIGKRLLPVLVENGHQVYCCVRDANRFHVPKHLTHAVQVLEVDFLNFDSLKAIPAEINGAYYLIHSMRGDSKNFDRSEALAAENFKKCMEQTRVQHVVYLSGIVNADMLSKHLASRKNVEEILVSKKYKFTTLRAGIIIGSGSASFEIMRDLVEKLPIMITPRWLHTKSQPIAIHDVIEFLYKTLFNEKTFNQNFDITGPDILSYKEMLLLIAKIRGLKRWIVPVPFFSTKLSSYWLYFVTSTSYTLAASLVDSMKVEIIGAKNQLAGWLSVKPIPFEQAVRNAFKKIEQNMVISSWKDSLVSGILKTRLSNYVQVPSFGCFVESLKVKIEDETLVLERLWAIGGKNGWYYANWLWNFRGFLDKLAGGVGHQRGRTNKNKLNPGDTIDLWRVLLADKKQKRLLLFAEMKLPGEAWLEFRIDKNILYQKVSFRPKGIWGRFYWYISLPFHYLIFRGMCRKIGKARK